MTSAEHNDDDSSHGVRTLQELLEAWQAWSTRETFERAARRAEAAGDTDRAEHLRDLDADEPIVPAVEALAAQHEVVSLLAGWEWQTVLAAREEGATWAEIGRAVESDPAVARAAYLAKVDRQEQAAAEYGWSFGMTADEARAHRDVAGQWFAELRPDIPDHVVEEIETAIARDDVAAQADLQELWWNPDHRPLAEPAADEPIPYVLADAARTEVVVSADDTVFYTSADINAIADAYKRGDQTEVERLHAGRPLLTPDPDPVMREYAGEELDRMMAEPDRRAEIADRLDMCGQLYREPQPPEQDEPEVARLECPECGEDAVEQPPETALPYQAHGLQVPRYAHPDGEPLCPVVGASGYEPAQPREVFADDVSAADQVPAGAVPAPRFPTKPGADEVERRGQLARWHDDDHAAANHGTEHGTDEGMQ